ncbi:MAG: ATPase, T2SS/T4P/T4SS family [Planctomycetota bacterium]
MEKNRKKLLGQALIEMGFISDQQLQEALRMQKDSGGPLGQSLVALGHLTPEQLAAGLGLQSGMDTVDLESIDIPAEAVGKIDASSARLFKVMPVSFEEGELTVALADPLNLNMLTDLEFIVNMKIKAVLSNETSVTAAIEKYYGVGMDESIDKIVNAFQREGAAGSFDLEDKESIASAGPVVRLLNYILYQAIRDKASDIHLEPFENEFKVRYRVDGTLYEIEAPPASLAVPLISRIKVMANLDIAESRIPQDGRIELSIGGRPVDLRISTLPTVFGESCVMRVLDRSVVSLDLDKLGLRGDEIAVIKRLISQPHGIILVTGPTGSGKTTTLYSALSQANDEGIKIITTEDPVEYDINGIVQIPINDEIGVTYSRVLRTILRQDPDMILVGEIRDRETAQIAIEASLTGHVVFSTLHTNDAPSTITRLIDIGIEPFLITATLEAVVAQRLVRRICVECKEYYAPGEEILQELNLKSGELAGKKFAFGRGCEYCNYSGYRGRFAIFEIMNMTERIRELVLKQGSSREIREAAVEDGMRGLRENGLLAIYDGLTTVEEVIRETMEVV